MGKEDTYYDEAERLYVRDARTVPQIAAILPVSQKTLYQWKQKGDWHHRRAARVECGKTVADRMREAIEEKLENMTDADNGPSFWDSVAKMNKILLGMEKDLADPRSIAVAAMDSFSRTLAREAPPEEREVVSRWIQRHFVCLEEA